MRIISAPTTVSAPAGPNTITAASGNSSIAAAATDYTKLNANPARTALTIQNTHGSATIRVRVGAVAYLSGTYFGDSIAPGGTWTAPSGGVRQDIHMASSTAGATYSLSEFESSVRTVGAGKTYSTITAAITAATAGDTIAIYPGVYVEDVLFNKDLKLSLPVAGIVEVRAPADPPTQHQIRDLGGKITGSGHRDAVLLVTGGTIYTAGSNCIRFTSASVINDIMVVCASNFNNMVDFAASGATCGIDRLVTVHGNNINGCAFNNQTANANCFINSLWVVGANQNIASAQANVATIKNAALIGMSQWHAITANASSDVTIQNFVAMSSSTPRWSATATNTLKLISGVSYYGGNGFAESVTGTGLSKTGVAFDAAANTPWLAGVNAGGYDNGASISFVWDDGVSLPGFEAACAVANLYGIKMSLAIVNSQMTTDYWNRIQALVNQGHGAVSHTWYHNNMGTLNALWFQYAGSGTNPVVSFDGTNITATADSGVDAITFAVGGYTLLNDLAPAFHALHGTKWQMQTFDVGSIRKGYSAALLPATAVATYDYTGLGPVSTLATFTNQPCSSVYVMLHNKTSYFQTILGNSIADINSRLGVNCATAIYPGHYDSALGAFDLDYESFGILGCGGGGGSEASDSRNHIPSKILRIQNYPRHAMDNVWPVTIKSEVQAKVHGLTQYAIATGAKICLYTHQNYYTQVGWVMEAVAASGIKVELFDAQIRGIRSSRTRSLAVGGYPIYSMPLIDYAKQQITAIKNHKLHPSFQGKDTGNAAGILYDIQGKVRSTATAIGPIERNS